MPLRTGQFLNLPKRYFPLLLNLKHPLTLLGILRGKHPLHLYAIRDLLLKAQRDIKELLIVDVLLLGLEIEDLEVIYVFEFEALGMSHGILYRRRMEYRYWISLRRSFRRLGSCILCL